MRDDDLAAAAGAAAGACGAAAIIAACFGMAPTGVLLLLVLGCGLVLVGSVAAPRGLNLSSSLLSGGTRSRTARQPKRSRPARGATRRPAHPRGVADLEPDDLGATAGIQPTDEYAALPAEPQPQEYATEPAYEEPQALEPVAAEPEMGAEPVAAPIGRITATAIAGTTNGSGNGAAPEAPGEDPVSTFLAAARAWVAGDRAAAAAGFHAVSVLDHPLAERAQTHLTELRAHGVELADHPGDAPAVQPA